MKKLIFTALLLLSIGTIVSGQRKIVNLPDIPGYVTLKCDFHMHTVFSDGDVSVSYTHLTLPTNREV